ncbi:uncharacterized protein LOC111449407 [Cucurbita moschata]|uniref:Uncharacterized protein LOC111449407 n=1 Tax=Cucurbita moschata TaxID=3662 RepID=A0A6J1FZQ2_CUCMO|nr:uncharacterized protein LOC111449407 [Cucurbita moschata]
MADRKSSSKPRGLPIMGKQRSSTAGHGGRTARANKDPNGVLDDHEASSTSAGCMCAVFHLFDFHPLNQHHHPPPPSRPVSLNPLDHRISTGTEAPRNSLESEEESPLSCTRNQKQDALHFPKGVLQIKTKGSRNNEAKEKLSGDSPSTKTPTLVARLMGLDLLPQSNSPSTTPRTASASPLNYPILHKQQRTASRSLPETPRSSCERRSNVENYHPRLSLQIPNYDKENASPSPSPSHHAKEIVKQIKESMSRKGGLDDITNYARRDHEMVNQTKPRKVLSCSSVSPRQRVVEPKNLNKPKQKVKSKAALKKSNKQEEPFVVPSRITKAAIDSPLKKTPLSDKLLSFSSVPTVVIKKNPPFSSPIKPTPMQPPPCNRNQAAVQTGDKESKRCLQSSNHQSHFPIHHHHQHVIQLPPINNINITTASAAANRRNHHDITAEVEYIRQILLRRSTTSTSVYSSVNFLENCNTHHNISITHRKLLSHLVEELLKPYIERRPYRRTAAERWAEVVEKVCEKVRKFPRAKCEVLEDIDGIIEKDMDILGIGFEEEDEGTVKDIEEWVVEELLNETVRLVSEVRVGESAVGLV